MTDHSQAMTAKYRQDYQAPLYWIDSIDLDFQLQEPLTRVTAISRLRRRLGDDSNNPTRIKTVRQKGYLLVPQAWE